MSEMDRMKKSLTKGKPLTKEKPPRKMTSSNTRKRNSKKMKPDESYAYSGINLKYSSSNTFDDYDVYFSDLIVGGPTRKITDKYIDFIDNNGNHVPFWEYYRSHEIKTTMQQNIPAKDTCWFIEKAEISDTNLQLLAVKLSNNIDPQKYLLVEYVHDITSVINNDPYEYDQKPFKMIVTFYIENDFPLHQITLSSDKWDNIVSNHRNRFLSELNCCLGYLFRFPIFVFCEEKSTLSDGEEKSTLSDGEEKSTLSDGPNIINSNKEGYPLNRTLNIQKSIENHILEKMFPIYPIRNTDKFRKNTTSKVMQNQDLSRLITSFIQPSSNGISIERRSFLPRPNTVFGDSYWGDKDETKVLNRIITQKIKYEKPNLLKMPISTRRSK